MAYMIDGGGSSTFSKSKAWLYRHPESSFKLLDIITEVCINFLVEQVYAGAQVSVNCQELTITLTIALH